MVWGTVMGRHAGYICMLISQFKVELFGYSRDCHSFGNSTGRDINALLSKTCLLSVQLPTVAYQHNCFSNTNDYHRDR